MRPRTLDLFCGGGGSSWGAARAGAEIVSGVDLWPLAVKTFRDNFPDSVVVERRLRPSSDTKVLGDIGPIDLIIASPECTNHTCARGARARSEESRATANYVLNFVRKLKPRWVVIENVIQMRSWPGYSSLISRLSQSYNVSEQVLNASDFGVPQSRRRLFILCDREQVVPNLSKEPTRPPSTVHDILDPPGRWRSTPLFMNGRADATLQRARRAIRTIGRGLPFLIVYYGNDGAGGWQSLDRPLRTMTTLDRFGLVEWDGKVATLRMLQVPELQRAMGFDDSYRLSFGSRRERIKLLGNGVCPPVMESIVRTLTRHEPARGSMTASAAKQLRPTKGASSLLPAS